MRLVKTEHRRDSVSMTLSWAELHELLVNHMYRVSSLTQEERDETKVTIEQKTEGSHSHSVPRWEATVQMGRDMSDRLTPK